MTQLSGRKALQEHQEMAKRIWLDMRAQDIQGLFWLLTGLAYLGGGHTLAVHFVGESDVSWIWLEITIQTLVCACAATLFVDLIFLLQCGDVFHLPGGVALYILAPIALNMIG
ncbi:hypothetical protein ACEUZ9_004109 [Paracoccus litorisediminis]|uniref:hypothetical protein n=1 Tax=Paracoccus litorisediminis TaxID=2006130 RepID=UPI00372FA3AE